MERGPPRPERWIDVALYISPVLAVRPHRGLKTRKGRPQASSSLSVLPPPPRFFTDIAVNLVFGDVASTIPSPIDFFEKSPRIPHRFLGCKNEMFGLRWLDLFFCSEAYSSLLCGQGVDSKYVAVNSDHWNVLNSTALFDALKSELRWIAAKFCDKNGKYPR